ncbi:MAG: sigma-70 family RNA polymerase sigma factor [Verrucomicrobiota bacterium]
MSDLDFMDDAELLRRFAAERSEASFAVLARRHTGLVLDIALRVTGSRPLAEEIVQNVFIGLARKASRVARTRVVIAWLHRAAVLESRAALRAESRRRKHLAEAALMIPEPSPPAPDPRMTELLQSLDEALDSLPLAEREILLRHYYDRQSYQEAGGRLGTSEAGARQLAARARKRLAAWFGKRGRDVSVSGIGILLAGHFPAASTSASAAAAQAALAASVTRAALSAAAPLPATILSGFLQCLSAMKLPAALCLLAGFLMTFLPGVGMERRDAASTPDSVRQVVRPSPIPTGRSKPGSGAITAGLTEGFDLAQFEKEMAAVVELSRERRLGFNARAASSVGITRAFDLSYGRQMQLARLVMNQPVSQMPALLAACRRSDPEAKGSVVLEAVFARWAEADPAAARAAMAGLSREAQNCALHGICGTLISRDVAAAAREALSFPTEIKDQLFDGSRENFIQDLVRTCLDRNLPATLQACLEASGRMGGRALERSLGTWIKKDPAAATEWFSGVCATRPVPGDGWVERRIVELLKQEHPDLAARLTDGLPAGELRDSLSAQLNAAPAVASPAK